MAKLKDYIPNAPTSTIPNKSVAVKNAAIEAAKPAPQIHIEGVVCDSIEAGHKHMYEFGQRKDMGAYNYAFLMQEEDGTLKLVERLKMPCWGAIREYECGTRPDDPWPTDLRAPRHIFPKTGNPIAVAFQFNSVFQRDAYGTPISEEHWNKFITEFVFNEEISPWRTILKDYELILVDNLITGVLFKDTKIDPTVLAHMLKYAGRAYNPSIKRWNEYVAGGHHPLTAWAYLNRMYSGMGRIVPEHFFLGQPPDFSNGKTFYERESYNRPDVEKLFGGKNNAGVVCSQMTLEQFEELRLSVMEKDNGETAAA
jgi:hypothetical protein